MKTLKKLFVWLFADFAYSLYELAEQKFTLHDQPFVISKTFFPNIIKVGQPSLLTLTIDNTAAGANWNNAIVEDVYPLGLNNTSSPSPIIPVGATLVDGSSGGLNFKWTIPQLLMGQIYTSSIYVTSLIPDEYSNINFSVFTDETGRVILEQPVLLTVLPQKIKKKRRIATPKIICCDPKSFKGGVCPSVVAHRGYHYEKLPNSNCYILKRR